MSLFGRTGKGAPFDWLVVGLGNPGPKYIGTRHNVGEDVVKLLAERHREQLKGGRDNALTAETRFGAPGNDERVVLSFPITYMNESGQAVGAQVRRYRIASVDRIIVIHDELDLDPGVLRVKQGGGARGPQRPSLNHRAHQVAGLSAGPDRRRQAPVGSWQELRAFEGSQV